MELEETLLREFEHLYNPAHMICKLHEMGLPMDKAKEIANKYETSFYKPLMKFELRKDKKY